LPNNIHISIEGVDNERLILLLEKRGILVAAGSACSASKNEPSHILRAIGVSEELAKSSIRITMGRDTSKEDIDYLLKTLVELVRVIKND
jgi:cysteine desulfurase